jgi:RNA polymerase sigma-70 factor (ECF subfamily)
MWVRGKVVTSRYPPTHPPARGPIAVNAVSNLPFVRSVSVQYPTATLPLGGSLLALLGGEASPEAAEGSRGAIRPTFPYARAHPMGDRGERATFPEVPSSGSRSSAAPDGRAGASEGAAPVDAVMDRFARGDDPALAELYRLGAPRVRAFLARLCSDLALADDLTQDAFLRIHAARGKFAAGAPAMPWMFAIARNSYRDHLRREQVRRDHRNASAVLAAPEQLERSEGVGDRTLMARQMLDVVQRALMGLPVRQREAFVLMRFEGLSLTEAAHVLGATEAAVKILVHRAYVVVRAALDKQNKADASGGKVGP